MVFYVNGRQEFLKEVAHMFGFEKTFTAACVVTAAVCFGVTWKLFRGGSSIEPKDYKRELEKTLARLRELEEHGFASDDTRRRMEEIERVLKDLETDGTPGGEAAGRAQGGDGRIWNQA